jgi:hypothetical protein
LGADVENNTDIGGFAASWEIGVLNEVHCVGPSNGGAGLVLCNRTNFIGAALDLGVGAEAFEELPIGEVGTSLGAKEGIGTWGAGFVAKLACCWDWRSCNCVL